MKDFERKFQDRKAKQFSIALEAVNHLFQDIQFGKKITFTDGRIGKIKVFVEPRFNPNDGTPEAGIDIQFENSHLEFFIRMTGWGGTV